MNCVARSRLSMASPIGRAAACRLVQSACASWLTIWRIASIWPPHRFAARQRQLAGHQVDRLDAVGAFVDRKDPGIAQVLGGAGLLDEAHAAVHLNADRGHLDGNVTRECLGHRRQQSGSLAGCRRSAGFSQRCARSIASAVA